MEKIELRKHHRLILWIFAVVGFLGINGVFLYSIVFRPELAWEAMENLYAMVFMVEAFVLLPLFCFLIALARLKSPNWLGFLAMSLLGSLAFAIPMSILLWTRK